jgi:membrane dipeptidase
MKPDIIWDNHACMPLRPDDASFLPQLKRHKDAGVNLVTLNVYFDSHPWELAIRMLAHFRDWINKHSDDYLLVTTVEDIYQAKQQNKLAIVFDIEGGCAINEQLSLVQFYYDLGVRWMLIAYNKNNKLGGGCQDDDKGLTEFGKRTIDEMTRVGMLTCCSHTGYKTAMQVMEYANNPVIFSHSNALALKQHPRNIPDELIKTCAETGGVIGINGVGIFLGDDDASTEQIVRHIDYVAQLVGSEHVGLGIDYTFDGEELNDYISNNPGLFPEEMGYGAGMQMGTPEQIPEIGEALLMKGYTAEQVNGVLGNNLIRVAKQVWK